ncbi:glycosyltransferase family 4 protein [Desulfofustis glycolicus]|uniref:Glycosyl transferases group 1 n=1 Tax=Desulfofustis glycolicus DSM 9705 TaxID=1121409 RepID=A0A1M5XYL3_9BACT|nr:glycosyltransferase family 4 protein [Desulfofustis glycolicus]SHI04911.1 Glycosyl transferases group 1 [Desulfofustis glycolicus DSM 9705]
MTDNAALFYVPDGYDTSGSKLMGRQAAGEAFLRGFAGFADIDRLVCCSHDATCYDRFRQQLAFFRQDTLTEVLRPPLPTQYVSSSDHVSLSKIGCLFYPSPALAPLAWGRRGVQSAAYSLCGITHTTASLAIMDALAELIVAPLEPWDAVICTSHAVKKMVEHFFQGYAADLQQRFGSSVCFRGQLPVIPLGVDCRQFDRRREEYKKGLPATGITAFDELLSSRNEEEVRVLFVGRLAFHAKAHPLPMYLALEEVARRSTKNIHLILAGWFANDSIRQTFVDGAERFCPSVTLTLLDGRLKLVREYVWYTADIFCSLSDNIQETFGITPLEAMAATLPVVVTDWNGYRETVKDGQDGFRIPTAQPPSGCAEHIAQAYANRSLNYDRYIGYL